MLSPAWRTFVLLAAVLNLVVGPLNLFLGLFDSPLQLLTGILLTVGGAALLVVWFASRKPTA